MLHIPTRQQNGSVRNRIYRCLYEAERPCTRQALARKCQISMPTLYQNLSELMEEGLVCDSGAARSTGGRKAMRLDIAAEARFAVGVSITAELIRLAAVDLRLRELAYREIPCEGKAAQVLTEPGQLAAALEQFLDENGLSQEKLLGVGITVPAIVAPTCDRVIFAPTLHIKDVSLTERMGEIPYPAYVDNDACCSGFAEWYIRHDLKDMAYLSLESGVGGVLILGGVSFDGDHRRSREFGHICIEPGGLRCNCGQRGCLEAYCSARRVTDELGLTLEEFFGRVEAHDPACETLWYDMLRHLAIGISNIHTAIDCDVVLGGWVSEYLPPYLQALKRYVMDSNPFAEDAEFVHLSTVRRHIAPMGAALNFVLEFVDQV